MGSKSTSVGDAATAVAMAAGFLLVAGYRLRTSPFALNWEAARAGAASVSADTCPAALVTWLALGAAVWALARRLRRCGGGWGPSESLAGALILLWVGSYVALLTLGPLGLYRPLVARLALAAVVVAAVAVGSGAASPWRARPGRPVALLAFALVTPSLLLLQLASPVSPFMDVLPYVASVQKIVTFHFYDAFANDAAGLWAPTRQVAGSDAFFSWVSLIGGVPASLGITSTMVALGGFQILAIYLLGRTVGGSLTGGFAALFLLQTFVWRRTADARGTALAFALAAAGLALLLLGHRERRPGKAAVGGAGLGIAVTVNPLIGALGLLVAGVTAVVEMIDRRHGFAVFTAVFVGAVALALPQVAIGLAYATPLWVLPVIAGSGVAVLAAAARGASGARRRSPRAVAAANLLAVLPLPAVALWLHARRQSDFFTDDWHEYAILTMLGGLGLLAGAALAWRDRRRAPATVPALALWIGVAAHALADPVRFQGTLEMRSLASEVTTKMLYYWTPYWLALAAGILFAALARQLGRTAALAMVLALTVYPVRQVKEHLDYDASELSIAESIGFNLGNAARGYFAGYPDRRWVVDQRWDVVNRALREEVAAGRLGYHTHVLHVTQSTGIEVALATGVSVDLVTPRWDPNSIWTVGGRSRGLDAVPELLAAHPKYVLIEEYPRERFDGLSAYEVLASAPRLTLFRLHRDR
ncbi:MAG: hypothetical protein IT294_08410 [Deltaproteobacteria bacterium]|nr:hypothetical protein [Deltaproteobacteria bacterium]